MLALRAALAIGISIAALLISIVLDSLLAPLPLVIQFLVQVPTLVLVMDELRRWLIRRLPALDESAINGTFFLAAPIAAFAARDLFSDIRRVIRA